MNRINTGFAVDPSPQQPFTTKSLDFLQDVTKEMITVVCKNIINNHGLTYSASTPYQLTKVASGPIYILFNNEIYILGNPGGFTQIALLQVTPDGFADPLVFSDGVGRNVHDNRNLIRSSGSLGTGLFDLVNIVDVSYISNPPWINVTIGSNWTIPTTFTSFANVFQYKINRNNEVQFRGYAKCVSGTGSSTIFTLPVGAIPPYFKKFIAYNGTAAVTVYIDPTTGDVICDAPVTNGYISIEQFRFSLD